RLSYPLDYANGAAANVWIGVPAAFGLATARAVPRPVRALVAGVAAALVATGSLALSRGGTLALALSLVVLVILSRRRLDVVLIAACVGIAFLAAYPLLF